MVWREGSKTGVSDFGAYLMWAKLGKGDKISHCFSVDFKKK